MKNSIFRVVLATVAAVSCLFAAGCHDDGINEAQAYLDADAKYLSVTKRGVTWSGEAVRIDLRSNTYWTASLAEADREWLALDRMGGDGDAVIELTVAENEGDKRTADIEFRALHGLGFTVTVSQNGAGESYYYYRDDFGTGASMADAAEYGFEPQGIGIFRGGYSSSGVAVDSQNASEGYEGASGGNNLYLHEAGAFVSYG
ncbi:MAG: BACON domain-containing protein, partial [Alistipes sp.]|nr:BACON domain-containing protein [Alistipes sp.]